MYYFVCWPCLENKTISVSTMDRILIITFLQRLKQTDYKVYFFVLGFIFIQLFLTFLKLEVTPFFLYGMYSEKIAVSDTFSEISITVNDKTLESYNSPMRERYLLETNMVNYEEMKTNNHVDILKSRIEKRYPFIYNSALYPFIKEKIYNSSQSQEQYKTWLRRKCLKIANITDGEVKVIRTTYLINKTTLQLNAIKHETLEYL